MNHFKNFADIFKGSKIVEVRKQQTKLSNLENNPSIDALRATLKELRNPLKNATNLVSKERRINAANREQARRLSQIRNQEIIRQQNRVYQRSDREQRLGQNRLNGLSRTDKLQVKPSELDERTQEFATFLAEQESLEGLSLEDAVKIRLKRLEEARDRRPTIDPFIEFSSIGFANELRMAQLMNALETNPVLVLVSHEFKELLKDQTQNNLNWLLSFWRELQKRRRKFKFVTDEDMLEILVAQFYPILLAAITKVLSRGINEDTISSEMPSYNGELVTLMRQAASEDHPAHQILNTVKNLTQFSGTIQWDDSDLI
ncbi:MAG: hypothetical protein NZO16_03135 [Deltaproteobacteria bacterium]|nr:hypothetical protein [Deltaproteobacteria bacterium]